MKRFQFRLEPVLRVRRRQLERDEGLVAATLRSLEAADATRREARALGGNEARLLAGSLELGLDSAHAWLGAQGVEHQWLRAAEGDQRVGREEERLTGRREALVAARRRLRVVERLREKALERHRLAEARAEQRALDDATACLRAHARAGRTT